MMGLFVHDHVFVVKECEVYTTGTLTMDVFNRYLKWCDDLKVMGRFRFASNDAPTYPKSQQIEGVSMELLADFWKIRSWIGSRKRIRRAVQHCDAVVARFPSIYGSIACHYAYKFQKPLMIEVVGDAQSAFGVHSRVGRVIAPLVGVVTRKVIKQAPFVLYVTQHYLQDKYPSLGETVGCSDVMIECVDPDILSQRLGHIEMCDENKLILGTIGPVDNPNKGQQYVIEVLALLKQLGREFEYHLVGKGDETKLRMLAQGYGVEKQVHFHGAMRRHEVMAFLDEIDVYIQPSQTEGLPRALIEAMSRGCPCVGTSVGGIPELLGVQDRFNRGNVSSLLSTLQTFNKGSMKQKAMHNFEISKQYYADVLEVKRDVFFEAFFTRRGV